MQLGNKSFGRTAGKPDSQFPLWDFHYWLDIWHANSQFPLWDFFECNIVVYGTGVGEPVPLNSLCGISVNATNKSSSLNSLCGISLNAINILTPIISQFPLWDFFECNERVSRSQGYESDKLSIPFVGFR
jgi:hypothetical protein